MKKLLVPCLILLLCCTLFALTVLQILRLDKFYPQWVTQTEGLENDIYISISDLLPESESHAPEIPQSVTDYRMSLVNIDPESRTGRFHASVTLNQGSEDSVISLVIEGEGIQKTIRMTTDGSGSFSTQLTLPLEENQGFRVKALVTSGASEESVELAAYSNLTSLMPVHAVGFDWSIPQYTNGILVMDFECTMEWQCEQPGAISNPMLEIYVNDELRQVYANVQQDNNTFRISQLGLMCAEDDNVRFIFRCGDSFGMTYTFPFLEILLKEGKTPDPVALDHPDQCRFTFPALNRDMES